VAAFDVVTDGAAKLARVLFSVRTDGNGSKSEAIFRPPWTELHTHVLVDE